MSDVTKRKRNRWGGTNNTNTPSSHTTTTNNTNNNTTTTADEKAMEALLSSAQSNEQKKRPAQPQLPQHTHRQEFETPSDDLNAQFRSKNNHNSSRQGGNDKQSSSGGGGDGHYGPSKRPRRQRNEQIDESNYQWGGTDTNKDPNEDENDTDTETKQPAQKPNFGLSGALAQDDATGNLYNGVLLKFTEPPEARTPNTRWRLYVFKKKNPNQKQPSSKHSKEDDSDDDLLEIMHVSKQSAYLFGRDRKVADIPVDHPSLSKQHCVLQYRALPDTSIRGQHQEQKLRCRPYLMDLESTHGTCVNGVKLEAARYYELRKGDIVTLGFSSREYVLLTENTTSTTV